MPKGFCQSTYLFTFECNFVSAFEPPSDRKHIRYLSKILCNFTVDTAVGTVGIVENEITGGGLGINVDVAGNSVLSGKIGNNNVSNTSETGIAIDALQQGQLANVTVNEILAFRH